MHSGGGDSNLVSELKGLILDMDGTLADTEGHHRIAFNHSFRELGLGWEWSVAEYADLLRISGGRHRIRAYAHTQAQSSQWSAAQLDETVIRIHQCKAKFFRQQISEAPMELRPGVRRLLEEAQRRKLRLAVATNSSRANFDLLMGNCGWPEISGIWDVVVSCDEVAEMKPSPAVYLKAIEGLGLPAANCVAIEDTRNGNDAARAAGLATVITTHLFTRQYSFPGASLVVDSLGDLDEPCTVVSGHSPGGSQVDVAWLQSLLEQGPEQIEAVNNHSVQLPGDKPT